jgi:hypothetical protein
VKPKLWIIFLFLMGTNIVLLCFLVRELITRLGAELDAHGMAMAAGTSMARADFDEGTPRVYELSLNHQCGRTGQKDGDLEIWGWPYIPETRQTALQFVTSYNGQMKHMIARPTEFPRRIAVTARPSTNP